MPTDGSRAATAADVYAICASLPATELTTSWGDVPTWKVPTGDKGKGFLMYRPPNKNATDPATGVPYDDLLVITTPTEVEKRALVEDESTPFITIDHFNGYNAVLVQQSRLGELTYDELREVIADAWATKAPKKLVAEFFGPEQG